MRTAKLRSLAYLLLLPLFASLGIVANPSAIVVDDYVPDVTQRVARISSIDGDVQIRRKDSDVWEVAELNLPVVEGDEIVTDTQARVEIQFDAYNYLRLFGRSYIRVANLTDSGVAISLSEGSLNARIFEFDPEKEYFEIDAPRSTMAVLEKGDYRIDAAADDVTIAVRSGEARVYLPDSAFLLKDGRLATVRIDGDNAALSSITSAGSLVDNFDVWTFELDKAIAERLENSNYNEYYDTDIYGAELLNEYGDWTNTDDYGYVWMPRYSATSRYSNWTPYRYGSWRWVPPYGWTWVNYEPWGWATYHYGRWVYWNGRWGWSPYSAYRYGRSWWSPALVVMNWYGGYYSWYPLPYSYHYYNYNYHWWNNHHHGNNGNNGNNNPTPTPIPTRPPTVVPADSAGAIPESAVITARPNGFDKGSAEYMPAPTKISREVLTFKPGGAAIPPLPEVGSIDRGSAVKRPIATTRPSSTTKIGATERVGSIPVNNSDVYNKRTFDERTRIPAGTRTVDTTRDDMPGGINITPRPTGTVSRPATPVRRPETTKPVSPTVPSSTRIDSEPVRRPSTPISRPSTPVKRPEPVSRPTTPVRRPSAPVSRPSTTAPRPSTPVRRPSAPVSRPSTTAPRPSTPVSRPSTPVRRPSAPVSRPSAPSKPATRPGPSKPSSSDTKKRDG